MHLLGVGSVGQGAVIAVSEPGRSRPGSDKPTIDAGVDNCRAESKWLNLAELVLALDTHSDKPPHI